MDTGRGLESPLETRSVASKKHLRIYADGKVVEGGGGGPFGTVITKGNEIIAETR